MVTILWSLVLSGCYVSSQAAGQFRLWSKRTSVKEAIASETTSTKVKEKLLWLERILDFAAQNGLETKNAYTKYIELEGSSVTFLVQARRPEEFKLKTWWFPFVGTVPYLGFFNRVDREDEAIKLRQQGFEVHEGSAQAFSSLGWFSDPIYSSMLRQSDEDFAHLIFHELTHLTAWIKGNVEFNENFAEFVADEMLPRFLEVQARLDVLSKQKSRKDDLLNFRQWLCDLKKSLQELHEADKSVDKSVWKAQSSEILDLAVKAKPNFDEFDYVGSRPWTVTRVLASSLYSPNTTAFQRVFECMKPKNMGEFARALKKELEQTDRPEEFLMNYCQNGTQFEKN